MKKQMHFYFKSIVGIVVIVFLLLLAQSSIVPVASVTEHENEAKNSTVDHTDSEQKEEELQEENTISHEKIIALTNRFMDKLVQKSGNNYKVANYHTKTELLDDFKEVASRDVANEYIEYYYQEKADGLYIVPTETPPWFNEKNDYDVVQLENNRVKVSQNNTNDLYGSYTVNFEFTYDSDWKITKITHS
ncbi:hypothetical protein ACFQ3N_17535 [Virgibacillus byunsanensis]|uniref:DUF3993 domain-containing protein n=1 Tax=Virgibacillus byunsanensis TaxID=570945 RepID=A0ABW3LP41_9BACI